MIIKTRGIIISETPYSDNSKIINVFTSDKGIISIMAKGAKSLKSKLRAVTNRFTYGDFHIYYKEDKLSTLIAVDEVHSLINLKSDIILISYLTYLTDLITQVFKQSKDNELFDLFIKIILKINDGMDPLILTNILEIKLLDYLGIGLNLDSCIKCGDKSSIVTIDPDAGGYICKKCYQDEMIVDSKTIQLIRMYYYIEVDTISKVDISSDISREINYFLSKYYDRYTGLYLKSKDFLEKVR